ncbi:MAG: hypothetical protein JWM91_1085 [Rhodospirillales bacterium]|nr:hypothetical protein [Rhodospirillales bacterium]
MNPAYGAPIRIAFVLTRDLTQHNGRTPILSHIIRTLRRNHAVDVLRLRSVMEAGGIWDVAGTLLCWLRSLALWQPVPLQCLLYASPRECARLTEQIRQCGCDAVYLDTVRCQSLLRSLRRALPDLHVVTDFDDLMSRRTAYLSRNRLPLLVGHVGPHLPRWLRFLAEGPLARLITAYETATLPAAEDEVVAASSVTILLSTVERQMLHQRTKVNTTKLLHAISPAFAVQAAPWRSAPSLRFIFIGSDDQLQNRTAIDYLLKAWRTLRPMAQLHIYGRQNRPAADVAGVHWHGVVEDLSQVYQAGSISLVPALVTGGIKTKVAEAWAWGCPVLGNDSALEGLGITNYPLVLPEDEWAPFLTQPSAYYETWVQAARSGNAFVRRALSPDHFERAWERAMHPIFFGAESSHLLPAEAMLSSAEQALR